MQQKLTILLALTIVLLTAIDAQISPKICPFGEITGIDPRWKPLPSRFELITELVEGDVVAEISQAFSPYRDAIVLGEMGSKFSFSSIEPFFNYFVLFFKVRSIFTGTTILMKDSKPSA